MRVHMILGLLLCPAVVAAQDADARERDPADALLAVDAVETAIEGLAERFFYHFTSLVPDLDTENQAILAEAIGEAFEFNAVRNDVMTGMASQAAPGFLAYLVEQRGLGPQGEMNRLSASYQPAQSLTDFIASLGDSPPRERLQLMAGLAEAEGAGDWLLIDEALRTAASQLANALGAGVGSFEPLSDEAYDAGYRERILARALELLHRLEPVPDEVVQGVIHVYTSEESQQYLDMYLIASQQAVEAAGRRLARMTVPDDTPVQPVAESVALDPDLLCGGQACGFLVEWEGQEPQGTNRRFGAASDLEARVFDQLTATGHQFVRGRSDVGVTLRLRARTTRLRCEVVSGTSDTQCVAIGQVRVEFMGSFSGVAIPDAFTLRNRCGADSAMPVNDFAALVGVRVQEALGTYAGVPEVPRC